MDGGQWKREKREEKNFAVTVVLSVFNIPFPFELSVSASNASSGVASGPDGSGLSVKFVSSN